MWELNLLIFVVNILYFNEVKAAVNYPLRMKKHFYTSIFYIGTPPKRFELAFDITSTVLWVYENDQIDSTESPGESRSRKKRQVYDPSESSTSTTLGSIGSSNMLLESIDLDMYRDIVVHENQNLSNLLFGTIEYDPQLNLYVPFDGLFGLDRFIFENMTTWPQAEIKQANSKVFTLYSPDVRTIDYNVTISPIDAVLTIGQDETFKNCNTNWTRLPIFFSNSSHAFFDFPLKMSQFQDKNIEYPKNAVFSISTLTSYITVDSQFYRLFMEKLKPKNETCRSGRACMTINCKKIDSLPLIEFWTNDGEKFVIPPRNYISKYLDGRCIVRVRENKAIFRNRWVLGSSFFHNYCVQFRYDNYTVGFSRAIHSQN